MKFFPWEEISYFLFVLKATREATVTGDISYKGGDLIISRLLPCAKETKYLLFVPGLGNTRSLSKQMFSVK